jgi:tetrahydromethanopterin S-methyltransferase subunit C
LTEQKLYFTIFKISQVVADPFIALAFIFSPFGIKHQNGINLGPFNPIASPKSSIKIK